MFVGDYRAAARRAGRSAPPANEPSVSIALVPQVFGAEWPRFGVCGDAVTIEMQMPSGQPGTAIHCRIQASPRSLPFLQRYCQRALHDRRSGQVIGALVLLLALCGWVIGGDEAACQMVSAATPAPDDLVVSPESMRQRFGARLLHPAEMPLLFEILADICRRAQLPRLPDLYYVAAPDRMNAYALGGPQRSAITVTEGLLHSLSPAQIAGILAHEVAHIRNNDGWAMGWAAVLQRAISLAASAGLANLRQRLGPAAQSQPLAMLLGGASAISQLLCMGLSRLREADADASALEWIDDPQALVAALGKLERHHAGSQPTMAAFPDDDMKRWLRSHPATQERVGMLLRLAPISVTGRAA